VDGREQKRYDQIQEGSLLFTPDGQRVAYVARAGEKWGFVLEGEEEKPYEMGFTIVPVFSPDSQRLALAVTFDNENNEDHEYYGFVVVDGRKQKRYGGIQKGSLVFSPDSKRLAYVAQGHERGEQHVVVDGRKGRYYDAIVAPQKSAGIIFDSPDQLHYIARKGNAFYLVENILPNAVRREHDRPLM